MISRFLSAGVRRLLGTKVKAPTPTYELLDQPGQLTPLLDLIDASNEVCLDTEADNMHRYRTRVCLLQFLVKDRVFLVDALAPMDFNPLWERLAKKHLVMHGSDYDLRLLHDLCGFEARSIFDTMLASQLLNRKRHHTQRVKSVLLGALSTFAAADALADWTLSLPGNEQVRSVNPVVGECNDGYLNDIRRRRVCTKDVEAALRSAHSGPVTEGCVGAGTGTRCMGWKGGIGSSSRRLPESLGGYTVGVLVQTNFGGSLSVAGVPVGRELGRYYLKDELRQREHGSCIVVVATDAPLDARRLKRLARRAPLGLAAAGSPISHGSGDYVLAFSTHKDVRSNYESPETVESVKLLRDDALSPLFQAVRDATEEAVINSLLQARTLTGHKGRTVEAIDPEQVREICRR